MQYARLILRSTALGFLLAMAVCLGKVESTYGQTISATRDAAIGTQQGPFDGLLVEKLPPMLSAVAFDRDGVTWLGTKHNRIYVAKADQFSFFDQYNAPLNRFSVDRIFVDAENTKWFASGKTLYSFDNTAWRVHRLPSREREFDYSAKVVQVRGDVQGRMWVAASTGSSGSLYRKDQGTFVEIARGSNCDASLPVEKLAPPEQPAGALGSMIDFDFDRRGRLWGISPFGLVLHNGATTTLFRDGRVPKGYLWKVWCDPTSDTVLVMTREVVIPGSRYRVFAINEDRKREILQFVDSRHKPHLTKDRNGDWVIAYSEGLIFGRGEKVEQRPLANKQVVELDDISYDNNGQLWGVGDGYGLMSLVRDSWQPIRRIDSEPWLHELPRLDWQRKTLPQLLREEPIDTSITDVLKSPAKYANKKLRIEGYIASGFEYSEICLKDSTGLRMVPSGPVPGDFFYEREGLVSSDDEYWEQTDESVKKKPQIKEYYGYLEWNGFFGHLGWARYQFTIVEQYPSDWDEAQRAELKRRHITFVDEQAWHQSISQYLQGPAIDAAMVKLDGCWEIVDGSPYDINAPIGSRWEFDNGRLTISGNGRRDRFHIRIDPAKSFGRMDLNAIDEAYFWRHRRTVYVLDGDKLTIGWTRTEDVARPVSVNEARDQGKWYVLKRNEK